MQKNDRKTKKTIGKIRKYFTRKRVQTAKKVQSDYNKHDEER